MVTWGHRDYGGDSRRVREQLTDVQQIQASKAAFAAIKEDAKSKSAPRIWETMFGVSFGVPCWFSFFLWASERCLVSWRFSQVSISKRQSCRGRVFGDLGGPRLRKRQPGGSESELQCRILRLILISSDLQSGFVSPKERGGGRRAILLGFSCSCSCFRQSRAHLELP